jgi:hypothetical protein
MAYRQCVCGSPTLGPGSVNPALRRHRLSHVVNRQRPCSKSLTEDELVERRLRTTAARPQSWSLPTETSAYGPSNQRCGLIRGIVFPDARNIPSGLAEEPIGLAVTGNVPQDLRAPVLSVGLGDAAVIRAAMPVAAVHEHGYLRSREHQIGTAIQGRQRLVIDAVSQACGMDEAPHPKFGRVSRRRLPRIELRKAPLEAQDWEAADTSSCSHASGANLCAATAAVSRLRSQIPQREQTTLG